MASKQTQDWEKELTEILDGVYEHRLKEVEAANRINKYISQALSFQLEEVEEWAKSNKMRFGDTTDYHMFLSKLDKMKKEI